MAGDPPIDDVHGTADDRSTRAIREIVRLWDEGLASGPAIDGEAAFEEIRIMLEGRMGCGSRPRVSGP
ncbi:transcriptional regulator (plasmid) [Tistrella mobilis]|uniref:transcriptional regulator n=2 Tax=Tistrella mobilis TaxID=171437 RepID=UPI003556FADD